MTTKNFWTEQRQQTLVMLWTEGKSAREIAGILGDGITRNAVIGKANRMGLSQQVKKTGKFEEPERVLVPSAKQCQWPFGDPGEPDFHFCGKPIQPDWPYCPEHCALAYRSLSDKNDDDSIEGMKAEAEAHAGAKKTPPKQKPS